MTSPLAVKGLKIVFWNAQSQIHKHHYICELLKGEQIDVLVILESWLRPDIENKFINVSQYTLCRQDCATLNNYNLPKRGGGICIYVRNSISFIELDGAPSQINNSVLELVSIKLNIENVRPIFLISVYRPLSGLIQPFSNHLIQLSDELAIHRKYDVICGGDLNIDYRRCSPNKKVLKVLENRFGLSQMITDKTRPLYSDAIIDQIFTNNPGFMKAGTLDLNVSDHLPVYIVRKKIKAKPINSEFVGRTYKHYNREILRLRLLIGLIYYMKMILIYNGNFLSISCCPFWMTFAQYEILNTQTLDPSGLRLNLWS